MRILILTFVLLAQVPAFAQQPDASVQHAAATVAHLHDTMLDPASFVLDGAFVTKADKHGNVTYCYAYRAQNQMGGYSEGRAVEAALYHGRLDELARDSDGAWPGYDTGWFAPCKTKNVDREITDDVATLAATLYKKVK